MKKTVALGMLLCVLLCGCEKKNDVSDLPDTGEEESSTREEETATSPESDSADVRLAYYEQLVTELQQELLNMKTELYASRVEYESRIAELEAGKKPEGGETDSDTNPSGDSAEESKTEADFRYMVENGMAIITSYIGTDRQIEIPATIDGYTVCAVGERAFMDNAKLTSVMIPKTVTSIGWFAFSGCVSLESVTIPATVESISYGAFQNCPSALTVSCTAGSYAEQYARSYGMKVKS